MIETIRVALAGLAANKLRSGLTILGLMIGVGSVIVLIAVGTGSSTAVENQIDQLGSNVLLVSGAPTLGGLFRRGGSASASTSTGLTVADADALDEPVPGARRRKRLPGGDREQRDLDLGRDHVLAVVVRRDDPVL